MKLGSRQELHSLSLGFQHTTNKILKQLGTSVLPFNIYVLCAPLGASSQYGNRDRNYTLQAECRLIFYYKK